MHCMNKFSNAQLWVHDQDEAVAFYTEKLGWRVREDITMPELGGFRWVSVSPTGHPETAIVLMAIPGEPVFDAETEGSIRELLAKGAVGAIFLTTDDVQAEYETLKGRGVEFQGAPEQQPWGIDCAFRDPSGNHIRLAQRVEVPAAV
jgi:catechol 2,3-dioxygenase-like lactoylglutathione lyase family enzyme